ncbi:MAG: hypothetical protein GQ574_18600 [Crocinitomix sp.]|nr:hypothetical protein [Crocinitomix sp.]
MIENQKIWFLPFIILLIVSCKGENLKDQIADQHYERPKKTYILPYKTLDDQNYFKLDPFEFHLPKGFSLSVGEGSDFIVYDLQYPGGISGGIAFSRYPDVPERISLLVRTDAISQELRECPGDPFNLKSPLDSLDISGYYTEKFANVYTDPFVETAEFAALHPNIDSYFELPDEEREKYVIRDSLKLEAHKIDATYIWKYFDKRRTTGMYQLLFSDKSGDGWSTHFFTHFNQFASKAELDAFSEQLISSRTKFLMK